MSVTMMAVGLVFALGYLLITTESLTGISKTTVALLMAVVGWTICMVSGPPLAGMAEAAEMPGTARGLAEALADTCGTAFYVLGAMIVVAAVDDSGGFAVATRWLVTASTRWLLVRVTALTFVLSMFLDDMTTAIIMVAVARNLVSDTKVRRWFVAMIVVAANAGGAVSPIGDVTTIMLWTHGRVVARDLFLRLGGPAIVSVAVPLVFVCRRVGQCETLRMRRRDARTIHSDGFDSQSSVLPVRSFVFLLSAFLSIPVLQTVVGLPPYMSMFGLVAIVWQMKQGCIERVMQRLNLSTVLFFVGILLAVGTLKQSGLLDVLAPFLPADHSTPVGIGLLSSVVDNVPLVTAAIQMFPVSAGRTFWLLMAYCASVGGSLLVIGSAAGIVAMGEEHISFGWYLRHMTPVVLLGAMAGLGLFACVYG